MRNKQNIFVCSMLMIIAAAGSAHSFNNKTDIVLEGVMANPSAPGGVVAIINGTIVKEGQSYEGYVVKKINGDNVELEPEGGGKRIKIIIAPDTSPKSASKDAPKTAGSQKQNNPLQFKFSEIMNFVAENKAIAEMKIIYIAAAQSIAMGDATSQGEYSAPKLDLESLGKSGVIPPNLAEGKSGGYQYSVESKGDTLEIHADPIAPDSTLKHFMLDINGVLYEERGKPATKQSHKRS